MEEIIVEQAPQDMESHERLAKIIRDWTMIEGGQELPSKQEEDGEEELAQDPCLKTMVQAGRSYLEAHPERTADDYGVKQAMALAAPLHNAAQQMSALNALRVEYKDRK